MKKSGRVEAQCIAININVLPGSRVQRRQRSSGLEDKESQSLTREDENGHEHKSGSIFQS